MTELMIEARGVRKRFGSTQALDGVSLVVERGTVLALLGPNGSGKTTLVHIMTTLLRPDSGSATVAGCDVVADAAALRWQIGLAGQYAAVDELLTGRENLELVGLWYHLSKADYRMRATEVLERFGLADVADRQVKTYSGGMRRRLDIGASLIGRPPVLLLDEPTTGLDPRTRNDVWRFVEELVAAGTTVLLTTQYMEEAERLAKRIVVLDRGSVIAEGTAPQLKAQVGGAMLEARVARVEDLQRAADLLTALDGSTARVDVDERVVSIPTQGGTTLLVAAGRRFEDEAIALDDLGIRRPSLDEVFLSLTGRTAGDATPPPVAPANPAPEAAVARAPMVVTPRSMTPALAARDTAGIAKRNLLRILRTPQLLVIGAAQPALMLLLFRYVLGGAIRIPGFSYVNYVVPAVFVEAVLIGGLTTSIGLAQDLKSGIIDRFRSLPMARSAVLAGRTLADLSRSVLSLAIMVGLGLLVGFQFHSTFPAVAGGLVLIIAFGYAFSWLFAAIGLATKDPETAQVAGILPFFILMFASNAVVPVATLPGWLQGFSRNQPLSVTVTALRALFEGGPAASAVWQSIAWSVGISVVFFAVSLRLYRTSRS
jgi:ABC-2 type transport system ATP-binding protein